MSVTKLSKDTAVNPFNFQCINSQLKSVNVNYSYRYYNTPTMNNKSKNIQE